MNEANRDSNNQQCAKRKKRRGSSGRGVHHVPAGAAAGDFHAEEIPKYVYRV